MSSVIDCGTCSAESECKGRVLAGRLTMCEGVELLDGSIIPQTQPGRNRRVYRKPVFGLNDKLLLLFRQAPRTAAGLHEMFPQYPEYTITNSLKHLRVSGKIVAQRITVDHRTVCEYRLAGGEAT